MDNLGSRFPHFNLCFRYDYIYNALLFLFLKGQQGCKVTSFHCPVSHGPFKEQSDKSCHNDLGYLPIKQPFGIWMEEKSVSFEQWKAAERDWDICLTVFPSWRQCEDSHTGLESRWVFLCWNQEELLALNGRFCRQALPDFENHIHALKIYIFIIVLNKDNERCQWETGLLNKKDMRRVGVFFGEWLAVCFSYQTSDKAPCLTY